MSVLICTPAYDGKVHKEYAQSLFLTGQDLAKRGIDAASVIMKNGCFIEVARNQLVAQFLESDYTHLMFIDADLGFEPHAVSGLVEAGLPLCAGVYRQREEKPRYCLHLPADKVILHKGWLQVDRVATGFMCIERSVLEEMETRAPLVLTGEGEIPFIFRTDTTYEFTGEDFCFCDDYMELHYEGVFEQPIWVWPDLTFDHDGYVGNLHEFLG
jgi:hypothetical protein